VNRALAIALACASCVQLDPSRPIELVADRAWSDHDVATLAAAADCWNLAFGMQFLVVTQPSTAQVVYFNYDALACWESWGRYDLGEPAHDAICPVEIMAQLNPHGYYDSVLLFTVAEHELGHAAGILPIVDQRSVSDEVWESAVMGGNFHPTWALQGLPNLAAFTEKDEQMLHDADPSFVPAPACSLGVELVTAPDTLVACKCR